MSCNVTKKQKLPIDVFIRIRPSNSPNDPPAVKHLTCRDIQLKGSKKYSFKQIFNEKTSQLQVYESVVSKIVNDVISGYNCAIFSYGQTGTGKTYTIFGKEPLQYADTSNFQWQKDSDFGIIFRAASNLFERLNNLNTSTKHTVSVSFLEIYNEETRDLLSDNENIPIRICEDLSKVVHVKNLKKITVFTPGDIYKLLKKGYEKRQVASTPMNQFSSKSHTVFSINVSVVETISITGNLQNANCGELSFIDLAGSDNISKSRSKEYITKETTSMSLSLHSLARVIKTLAENASHIPYRESKLTRILHDSLGGKTKTSIIATIFPGTNSLEETINTLEFASNATRVTNYPLINIKSCVTASVLQEELKKVKQELFAMTKEQGIYMHEVNYEAINQNLEEYKKDMDEKHEIINKLSQRIEDLMAQKEEWEKLCESFSITQRELQDCEIDTQMTKKEIENDNAILKYYESELMKFHEYFNLMNQREIYFRQKVDNICAHSVNHQNALEKVIYAIEKIIDELLHKSSQTSQQISRHTGNIMGFNNEISQMIRNFHIQLSELENHRKNELEISSGKFLSDDKFLIKFEKFEQSFNVIKNKFIINCSNDKLKEATKLLETIRNSQRTIIDESENFIIEKVKNKEIETKEICHAESESLDKCQALIKSDEMNMKDMRTIIEEELKKISKEEGALKRKQTLLKNLKKKNEIEFQDQLNEYVKEYLENKNKICDFTKTKQDIESSAEMMSKKLEEVNEKFTRDIQNMDSTDYDELSVFFDLLKNEINEVVLHYFKEDCEMAEILGQIVNDQYNEAKRNMIEMKSMVDSHSEIVPNAQQNAKLTVKKIIDSVAPLVPSGNTPQRLDHKFSIASKSRDSITRELAKNQQFDQPGPSGL